MSTCIPHLHPRDFTEEAILAGDPGILSFLRNGGSLSEAQKRIIEHKDYWIIAFMDEFNSDIVKRVGYCFCTDNFEHYNAVQGRWIETDRYFLGEKLQHNPSELELIQDYMESHNDKRHRLCYALKYPDKVSLNKGQYYRHSDEVDEVLEMAQQAHPENYPYFERIVKNRKCPTLLHVLKQVAPTRPCPALKIMGDLYLPSPQTQISLTAN